MTYPDSPSPRTESGFAAVLEQARLVAQWHDAIGSGPIEVLNAELGLLGELVRAAQEAPAPEGENPMNDSDLHRQGGHAGATNPRCPLCNPLDDFCEGQIAGATQMADYAAGRLAATRDLLRAAIGTTDADEGLPHFHEADGKPGVFVDRQQVLDTVARVLASQHPHDGYAYDGCGCVCCRNVRLIQHPRAALTATPEGPLGGSVMLDGRGREVRGRGKATSVEAVESAVAKGNRLIAERDVREAGCPLCTVGIAQQEPDLHLTNDCGCECHVARGGSR